MGTNDIEELVTLTHDPKWLIEGVNEKAQSEVVRTPNAEEVYRRLWVLGEDLGFEVSEHSIPLHDGVLSNGRTHHLFRTIEIAPNDPYRKAVTLAHELAHVYQGRGIPHYLVPYMEVYAESVAFLVAKALQWPTDAMVGWMAVGADGAPPGMLEKVLRAMAPSALRIARRIVVGAHLEPLLLAA